MHVSSHYAEKHISSFILCCWIKISPTVSLGCNARPVDYITHQCIKVRRHWRHFIRWSFLWSRKRFYTIFFPHAWYTAWPVNFFTLSLLSVNAVTPGCKSSDEILVKNAQNLLQTVLRGVHAAETACMTVILTLKRIHLFAIMLQLNVQNISKLSFIPGFEAARAKLRWRRGHSLVFPVEEEAGDPSSPADIQPRDWWTGIEEDLIPPCGTQPCPAS